MMQMRMSAPLLLIRTYHTDAIKLDILALPTSFVLFFATLSTFVVCDCNAEGASSDRKNFIYRYVMIYVWFEYIGAYLTMLFL